MKSKIGSNFSTVFAVIWWFSIQSISCVPPDFTIFTEFSSQNIRSLGGSDNDVHSDTTLACGLLAGPILRFRYDWFVDDSVTPVPEGSTGHLIVSHGLVFDALVPGTTLTFCDLSYKDSGRYRCVAQALDPLTQEIGTESLTLTLNLIVRLEPVNPIVSTFNDSNYVRLGCDMAGYIHPDRDLYWTVNGQELLFSTNSSKYSISYANGSHVAQFGGEVIVPSRVSWLTVIDVHLVDSLSSFSCAINGTEHTANVTLDVKQASSPSGFPTGVLPTATSLTSIRLEWNNVDKEEQNGNITHFELVYYPSSSPNQSVSLEASWMDRSIDIQGLDEFTYYNVCMRAFTVVGAGPYSPPVTVRTQEDVPSDSPKDVLAVATSSTTIMVSWNEVPENDRNGIITHYMVNFNQSSFQDVPVSQMLTVMDFFVLLENLEEFVEYSVRVRAFTNEGGGPYSDVVMATTKEDRPSSSPNNLSLVSFNSSSVGLRWNQPVELHINGLLRHYIISYCTPEETMDTQTSGDGSGFLVPEDSMKCSFVNVSGNSAQTVINGLDDGALYTVSVSAVTVAEGPYASESIQTGDNLIEIKPAALISLGPDSIVPLVSIVCTVSNSTNIGRGTVFTWQWKKDGENVISMGNRFKATTSQDTLTTTLTVDKLRYSDAGDFQCGLFITEWEGIQINTNTATVELNFDITAITPSTLLTEDQTPFELVCGFYGYLPTDKLIWYHQVDVASSDGSIVVKEVTTGIRNELDDELQAQTGQAQVGLGVKSILRLSLPNKDNAGRYFCALPDDISVNATIDVAFIPVNKPVDPDNTAIIIGVIVGVVTLLVICVTLIIVGVFLYRKTNKQSGPVTKERGTVTALEDFVPVHDNTVPEKVSLDLGEELLLPVESSTPIPIQYNDSTHIEQTESAIPQATEGTEQSQVPKLDLADHVSEEPPRYEGAAETSAGDQESTSELTDGDLTDNQTHAESEIEKQSLDEIEDDAMGVDSEETSSGEVLTMGLSNPVYTETDV